METTLDTIHRFASEAHAGKNRPYTPESYIVHPERVSGIVAFYDARLPIIAAALLHDVLEKTSVTEKQLYKFLYDTMPRTEAAETLLLVFELTNAYTEETAPHLTEDERKKKEHERLATLTAEAQTIKYADVLDNVVDVMAHSPQLADEYLIECHDLLLQIDKGNPSLRARALELVKSGLQLVKAG